MLYKCAHSSSLLHCARGRTREVLSAHTLHTHSATTGPAPMCDQFLGSGCKQCQTMSIGTQMRPEPSRMRGTVRPFSVRVLGVLRGYSEYSEGTPSILRVLSGYSEWVFRVLARYGLRCSQGTVTGLALGLCCWSMFTTVPAPCLGRATEPRPFGQAAVYREPRRRPITIIIIILSAII